MESVNIVKKSTLILLATAIFAFPGCSKNKRGDDGSMPTSGDRITIGDSDSDQAGGLQTINFPFDSYLIDSENKRIINQNISVLKDKKSVNVQIEGHCDQRGGIQYNLALGEKRANAVRRYLIEKGVSPDRVSTISFGKERLLDPGSSEEAYAKNRRANFVITSQ